jgi:chromate transporter
MESQQKDSIMKGNQQRPIGLNEIFWVFLSIGATSFGGGLVAYLREHLVAGRQWLDEEQFLAALEIGETVPGLISTNVSVIVGSRLRGVRGAIAAAAGIILPGAIAVFALGLLYGRFKGNPEVAAALDGVGAAAVGLVLAVSLQIGSRSLRLGSDLAIVICAFMLVGVWHISLVPVLVVLAPIAIWIHRPGPAELAAYHSKQAAMHAELAARHSQRTGKDETVRSAS